mgnify:CR=1 FL=1
MATIASPRTPGKSPLLAKVAGEPDGAWWLQCCWRPGHRHAIATVHPLLVKAQQALGRAWLTTEHVLAVLDATDPAVVVRNWLAARGGRACQRCGGRFAPTSPAQRYCRDCRPGAYRRAARERMRRFRRNGGPGVTKLGLTTP